MVDSNIIKFPKPYRKPPVTQDPKFSAKPKEKSPKNSYIEEVFDYGDDSYVVLVNPKNQPLTIERMVFMSERLKLQLFDLLQERDCYLGEEDEDPPPHAS